MIYRDKHRKYYTCISNDLLRNTSLTMCERALLAVMLTLPDDWNFCESVLAKELQVPASEIGALLQSLERKGYVKRRTGRYGVVWDLYEKPNQKGIASVAAADQTPPAKRPEPKTDDYGLTYGELLAKAQEARKAAQEQAKAQGS